MSRSITIDRVTEKNLTLLNYINKVLKTKYPQNS